MLDQRQLLLSQLQEKLPVNIVQTSSDTAALDLAVFSTSGMPLIIGKSPSTLDIVFDATNNSYTQVWIEDSTGVRQNMTPYINSGEMGGAIDMRDNVIPEQLRWIDELSAKFGNAFNLQHGQGLNNAGINFFEPLRVYTAPSPAAR